MLQFDVEIYMKITIWFERTQTLVQQVSCESRRLYKVNFKSLQVTTLSYDWQDNKAVVANF